MSLGTSNFGRPGRQKGQAACHATKRASTGVVQAYNAQAAVDAEAQIIAAQDVTQSAVDCGQLVPMTDAIEANLGRKPAQLSADAGYC